MKLELDHLVLAARTLDEGVAWCERTLGITPAPVGRHALMSTHNRVFSIASVAFPRAYFEIIASDPDAPDPGRARWFGLDDAALQTGLALQGPQLVQWVARCVDLDAALAALAKSGIDGGSVLAASRPTPQGELRWRIAVPDDGARALGGALPLLIEWGEMHPTDALPESGVSLSAFAIGCSTDPAPFAALGLSDWLAPGSNPPTLAATLGTPKGNVTLTASR
jgi:Glyoxalase-like domain